MTLAGLIIIDPGPMLGLLLLVGIAMLLGSLAHHLGVPRFVGGVIAGLMMGAAVLGNVWPDAYHYLVTGQRAGQLRIDAENTDFSRTRQALIDSGVTDVAVTEAEADHAQRIDQLEAERDHAAAVSADQRSLALLLLGAIALFTAGVAVRPGRWGELWRDGTPIALAVVGCVILIAWAGYALFAESATSAQVLALALAACAAALPVSPIVASRLARSGGAAGTEISGGLDDLPHVALGGATALGVVVWIVLGASSAAGALEPTDSTWVIWLVSTAGVGVVMLAVVRPLFGWMLRRCSRSVGDSLVAVFVVAVAAGLLALGSHFAVDAPIWLAALLAGLCVDLPGGPDHSHRTFDLLLPVVAGLVALQIDVAQHLDWLLLLGVLVLYGDVKAMGAMLAARFGGNRSWWDALRVGTALAAGGAVPLLAAVVLHEGGWLNNELFTALVLAITITAICVRPMLAIIDRIAPRHAADELQ